MAWSVKFPVSRPQLQAAGYVFKFARPCKRCHAPIEFYQTPTKALAPLEGVLIDGEWLMDSHFKSCPFREEFKKSAPAKPPTTQGKLFGGTK